MEVILLKDVDKVGLRGEVVNVSRGYMRNFLGPRRLAEPATPARVAELEKRGAALARHEARSFEQAQEIAQALEAAELRFDVNAGPTGTLFGSVTPTDIADELWQSKKIRVDRRKIGLAEPIKRIGRYSISIEIFQDVNVEVRTLVVPEGGELPPEEELEAMAAAEAAEASADDEAVSEGPSIEEIVAAEEEAERAEAAAAEEAEAADSADREAAPDVAYAEQAAAAGAGPDATAGSETAEPQPDTR